MCCDVYRRNGCRKGSISFFGAICIFLTICQDAMYASNGFKIAVLVAILVFFEMNCYNIRILISFSSGAYGRDPLICIQGYCISSINVLLDSSFTMAVFYARDVFILLLNWKRGERRLAIVTSEIHADWKTKTQSGSSIPDFQRMAQTCNPIASHVASREIKLSRTFLVSV